MAKKAVAKKAAVKAEPKPDPAELAARVAELERENQDLTDQVNFFKRKSVGRKY